MRASPTAFLIAWLAFCQFCIGAGTWNGVAATAWNGVAATSWNGTSISFVAGGATSYANSGGTGDRQSIIAQTNAVSLLNTDNESLINGTTATNENFFSTRTLDGSSYWIKWNFGSGKIIDEAKYYQQNTTAQGTWKWQGSNNDTDWTDIGSSFSLGGSATQTITALSGNATSYQYYRLMGVSGSTSNGPFIYEMEFKIN